MQGTTLAWYEARVAEDLEAYAKQLRHTTEWEFGAAIAYEIEQFLQTLLAQKHLGGALVLVGYEMEGGKDQDMIIRAARAVEMFHAVVTMQRNRHAEQNATEAGERAAQLLLANLEVDAEVNRRAVSIMNRTLLLSAHAQTARKHDPHSAQALAWEALERSVNPIHVGMVLADADCHATDAITPFATAYGQALLAPENEAQHYRRAAQRALPSLQSLWPAAGPLLQSMVQSLHEK